MTLKIRNRRSGMPDPDELIREDEDHSQELKQLSPFSMLF